jgi:5-methyltetrahydrofolate--homocysteine methyltransferase
MFHPGELEHAVHGSRRGAPGLPLVASMTVMPGASGLETPHGVPIRRMVRAVQSCAPDAVGVNCSIEAERMLAAVVELRTQLPMPVWARPQAKLSQKCATPRSTETAEQFAQHALALARAGAAAVGGCCGVGPSGIAALRAALDRGLAGEKAAS